MGKHSKKRRDMKRSKDMVKKGNQILSKKKVAEELHEKIMAFASFLTTWNGRMIAIKQQVEERKVFFTEKDMPEVVKLCDTIINDITVIQEKEYPPYLEHCKSFITKMGEISKITDRVTKDMETIDLMESFHSTRSYMDKVMVKMDTIVRNVHLVLNDEPTVATPTFTNSTSETETPSEDIHIITPEEQFSKMQKIGSLPTEEVFVGHSQVIDVEPELAEKLVNEFKGETPDESSVETQVDTKISQ